MKTSSIHIKVTPEQEQFLKIFASLRQQTVTDLIHESVGCLIKQNELASKIKNVFNEDVEFLDSGRKPKEASRRIACLT